MTQKAGMAHGHSVRLNESLRQELLALAEQEQSFLGSPEHDSSSDEVQRQLLDLLGRLTRRLVEILDTYGWPGMTLVGEDGAEAAWTLALHTMHDPDVLRRCLTLLQGAAAAGRPSRGRLRSWLTECRWSSGTSRCMGPRSAGGRMGASVRPCWKIPIRWMSAGGRSVFLLWDKTFARSKGSTAASTSSRHAGLRADVWPSVWRAFGVGLCGGGALSRVRDRMGDPIGRRYLAD
jgi:hypothetical protein